MDDHPQRPAGAYGDGRLYVELALDDALSRAVGGGLRRLLQRLDEVAVAGAERELAFSSSDSDLIKALQQSTQSTTNRAGQRLVERNLNVQPTITVRPGWPLRVIVHKDIVLRPYRGTASK